MPGTRQNTVLVISHNKDDLPDNAPGVRGGEDLERVAIYLEALAGGVKEGEVVMHRGSTNAVAARATGTVTCATVVATNTVTINGTVFTAVTGAAAAQQFDRSGTDTQTAANLAAAINASTDAQIQGIIEATSVGAVVTISVKIKCELGNAVTLASSGATLTLGGLSNGRLSGGVGGDAVSYRAFTR